MPIAPLTPPAGYREDNPDKPPQFTEDSVVEIAPPPTSEIDPATGAQHTYASDGSVTIDPNPTSGDPTAPAAHEDNLALHLTESELSSVAEEVLQGIDNDISSRSDWDNGYKKGIQLMGLKLEDASSEINSTGSISKVYHPLLIETTVRYQSNAMAEMLPAAGPVKVYIAAPQTTDEQTQLAEAFENDFNHYLTTVAKEYYPDTDQLLFNQGWSGMAFKKIFECPIRKRPCSDLVLAPDLIVSNDVVDLETAGRITHRTYLSNGMIRRMQKAGVYRKVELGQAVEQPTVVEEKVADVANIDISTKLPTDHRHTIYECYVELDLPGHTKDIPCPYVVTIDKDSRQVLSIYKNWEEGDEDYKAECRFVKYGMIPALGFYDLGFVHLLGNTTRALTAILRMQLDAGQFSIFPGFLFSKQGGRQITNEIRIAPGTGKEIDTGGLPIGQVAMALPYPGPSSVLASISEKVAEDGLRLGMASQVEVGDGRADVPVGTTMALIEQATKVMAAVHKRNHVSQQREFEKLRKLFNKNPQALWSFAKNPARKWQMAEEFKDFELVPASDPNIPSHTHRLMQSNALVMLAQGAPDQFNKRAVTEVVLRTLGYKNPETLLAPMPQPGAPPPIPPEIQAKMAELDLKKQQMQLQAQQQAAHDQVNLQKAQMDTIAAQKDRDSKEKLAAMQALSDHERQANTQDLENMRFQHDMTQLNAQHNSQLQADVYKHNTGIMADAAMHSATLQSQEYQAEQKAKADAAKAKAKPTDKKH